MATNTSSIKKAILLLSIKFLSELFGIYKVAIRRLSTLISNNKNTDFVIQFLLFSPANSSPYLYFYFCLFVFLVTIR